MWQYNAWSSAYRDKMRDALAVQIQASYLGAYWGSASKNKKSLQSVLKGLHEPVHARKEKKKIVFAEASRPFKQFEELTKNGYTQIDSN